MTQHPNVRENGEKLIQYLTVQDVARQSHFCVETIRIYIRTGKVKATKIGREYRIPTDEYKRVFENFESVG